MHDHDPCDGKLDLVPMIDCVMLILLFFILTSTFLPDERAMDALLPTTNGSAPKPSPDKPQIVNLRAWPEGFTATMPTGAARAGLTTYLQEDSDRSHVVVQVGRLDPLVLDLTKLQRKAPHSAEELTRLHEYIADYLAQVEEPGNRTDQTPVAIHCFSALPWAAGAILLDAVRAYEHERDGTARNGIQDASARMAGGREISLAPPRIRDSSPERLDELREIMVLR